MRRPAIGFMLALTLMLSGVGCGVSQTVDNKEASDILEIAVTTAVAYGVTHNGSYNGMDAAGLAMINGQLKWTDGQPQPGQVQVASANGDDYVIIYKDPNGAVYTATRQDNTVTFTDGQGSKP